MTEQSLQSPERDPGKAAGLAPSVKVSVQNPRGSFQMWGHRQPQMPPAGLGNVPPRGTQTLQSVPLAACSALRTDIFYKTCNYLATSIIMLHYDLNVKLKTHCSSLTLP